MLHLEGSLWRKVREVPGSFPVAGGSAFGWFPEKVLEGAGQGSEKVSQETSSGYRRESCGRFGGFVIGRF